MQIKYSDIEQLEKVSGQMDGLHKEISALARKSPNDALNKFKLKFINAAILDTNKVLGAAYMPLAEFSSFDPDDVPSNSDVTMILGLYIEELERKRADSIKRANGIWVYNLSDSDQMVRTAPPRKIAEKKT